MTPSALQVACPFIESLYEHRMWAAISLMLFIFVQISSLCNVRVHNTHADCIVNFIQAVRCLLSRSFVRQWQFDDKRFNVCNACKHWECTKHWHNPSDFLSRQHFMSIAKLNNTHRSLGVYVISLKKGVNGISSSRIELFAKPLFLWEL